MERTKLQELQKNFVNYRFGMFLHFNSATFQMASLDDWDYGIENGGEQVRHVFSPDMWNPTKLDCTQWARAAKAAGMEFAVLTAKHHEGFDLWPSQYTYHCVKNAPVSRDVVREFVEAFRAVGVVPGLYFSMLDLQHTINRKKCLPEDKKFIKNQLAELCTNYGDIPFLIIDGWNAPWGGPRYADLPFDEITDFIRSMQPDCLVMNIGEADPRYTDIAFYENAAGQELPGGFNGPGVACHVTSEHWFWKETDPTAELKSVSWVLEKLRSMNERNTTFILNAAPNQQGLLDDNLTELLQKIGKAYQKMPDLTELPANWLCRA